VKNILWLYFLFLEYDNNYDNYNNEYDGYNSPHDDYDPDMVKKEEPDEENANGSRYSNNVIWSNRLSCTVLSIFNIKNLKLKKNAIKNVIIII